MSSLAEIQEAIEKLAPEDRARLREWFDAQDAEETDEPLVAIDEGIRSGETERTFRNAAGLSKQGFDPIERRKFSLYWKSFASTFCNGSDCFFRSLFTTREMDCDGGTASRETFSYRQRLI